MKRLLIQAGLGIAIGLLLHRFEKEAHAASCVCHDTPEPLTLQEVQLVAGTGDEQAERAYWNCPDTAIFSITSAEATSFADQVVRLRLLCDETVSNERFVDMQGIDNEQSE